ncbi:stress response protein NST1 isoform X2 [Drosophila willistoni]|uniref:stress response protein NST1 isoform X2 n=1 Tax=Drosophila willistoni TaxID=7260 RepID=UPI001F072A61|nr:stress response protein NST1 isoform X2 [Drosophila willistoni]
MAKPPLRGGMGQLLLIILFFHLGSTMTTTAPAPAATSSPSLMNRNQQRLQQLQAAQLEADGQNNHHHHQSQPHHHLRHEQHLRAELEEATGRLGNRQPPTKPAMENWPQLQGQQQHHLRHHNRHHLNWQQRVLPSLHLERTTDGPLLPSTPHPLLNHSRYFDREGIYPSWAEPRSTRAPNWRQELDSSDDDDDDDDDDDSDSSEDYDEDEDDAELINMPRYSLFNQKLLNQDHPAKTIHDDDDDDYDAYDQIDEVTPSLSHNKHPSVANHQDKTSSKRYIFDWLFKRDKPKEKEREKQKELEKEREKQKQLEKEKEKEKHRPMTTEKPHLELIDANLEKDDSLLDASEIEDSDSVESFSSEKWNKIEHDHHLKQQKHQKELKALRDSNRNTPLIRSRLSDDDNNEVRDASPKTLEEDNSNGRHDAKNIYISNDDPGRLTEKKNKELGTLEDVIEAQRQHARKQRTESALASKHFNQVMKEASCRIPQRRCKRLDHDSSKNYSPHCAILHRCSEDSGCCHSPSQICAPKSTRNVELYFYVSSNRQPKAVVEKRTFANHTECHCIERARYEENEQMLTKEHATILNCNCPAHFEKILQDDGQCRCDCSSGNAVCNSFKEGIEHFAMKDRKCIVYGLCKPPTCAFGNYLLKHGQCPKQPSYNVMS